MLRVSFSCDSFTVFFPDKWSKEFDIRLDRISEFGYTCESLPRRIFLEKILNQISIWFSQLADVGV